MTATDSDDQDEPGFFDQAYDDAMKMELRTQDAWKGRDMANLYPSQGAPLDGIIPAQKVPSDHVARLMISLHIFLPALRPIQPV